MTRGAAAFTRAAMIGASSGMRSISGIAAVSNGLAAHSERAVGSLQRGLARPRVARALTFAALAEIAADKLPGIPPRTEPLPLAGRIALGALAAAAATDHGRAARLAGAIVGGATAAAATFLAYHLRRDLTRRGASDTLVALGEDITVLEVARQNMAALGH